MGRVEDMRRMREAALAVQQPKTAQPPALKPVVDGSRCVRCGGSGKEPLSDAEVGKLARSTRMGMGLTQVQVSREVGCPQSLVSHLEAGRRGWSSEAAKRILSRLGLQV